MRVVLDTNVLVSGIFFRGSPHEILSAWRDGRVRLVVTLEIVREYEAVLERLQTQYPAVDATDVLALIVADADVIAAPALAGPVSANPDDDKFLACAVAGPCPVHHQRRQTLAVHCEVRGRADHAAEGLPRHRC